MVHTLAFVQILMLCIWNCIFIYFYCWNHDNINKVSRHCRSFHFCTDGLQVTLFNAFGVPLLGSWRFEWRFDWRCTWGCSWRFDWKFSAREDGGWSWTSPLLVGPWGGKYSVSQSFVLFNIFDFTRFSIGLVFGADMRNCSVSCARPVISDRHFGHVLEWRSNLKILNWKSIKQKSINGYEVRWYVNEQNWTEPTYNLHREGVRCDIGKSFVAGASLPSTPDQHIV